MMVNIGEEQKEKPHFSSCPPTPGDAHRNAPATNLEQAGLFLFHFWLPTAKHILHQTATIARDYKATASPLLLLHSAVNHNSPCYAAVPTHHLMYWHEEPFSR